MNIGCNVCGSVPKKDVGTNAKKNVIMQTTRKDTHLFTFIGCPINEKYAMSNVGLVLIFC